MTNIKLARRFETIVNQNVKEIPFEGLEIDKEAIAYESTKLVFDVMKGYGKFVMKNVEMQPNGWFFKPQNKILSQAEVIDIFIDQSKL